MPSPDAPKFMPALATAVALALVGCSTSSEQITVTTTTATTAASSSNKAVSEWGADELSPSVNGIADSLAWVAAAIKGRDFSDARAGCRELDDQVEELQQKLPSPDAELTSAVQEAVDSFRYLARDCQGLHRAMSQDQLDAMKEWQELGLAAMGEASEIVQKSRLGLG